MSDSISLYAEWCALIVEAIGVFIITALAFYVLLFAAVHAVRGESAESIYHTVRQRLGLGILLGLEFLVAADIIHTVAVDLSFSTVGVLAVIVVIRTFLSFTLDLELTGRWPWQKPDTPSN